MIIREYCRQPQTRRIHPRQIRKMEYSYKFKEMEIITKTFSQIRSIDLDGFNKEFYQTFKEEKH